MKNNIYDVVVIGAGSGGLTSAVGLSKVGKKVLLIERDTIGGECTNSGCVPSKALLHHAKNYYQATKIAGKTEQSENYRHEAFNYVRSKINEILAEEKPEHFQNLGIDVVFGEAVFASKNSLTVGGETYHFKNAIIATGSSPRPLSVPGLDPNTILTNQNIFKLTELPERMLIIGAGPIGLEMGQALAMLRSTVTLATIDTEVGRLEDPAIRPILQKQLATLGIEVLTEADLQKIDGNIATFTKKTSEDASVKEVVFDKILIAIGRVPNLPSGLEKAGVDFANYGIIVDGQYRTTNKNIYALGDVAQKLKFTHTADDAGRQVVTRIVSKGLLRIKSNKAVPKVTYTLPEIAQVGLSQAEATAQYDEENIMRIEVPFSQSDRAKTDDDTSGLHVVIVKRLSGKIIGAHLIGPSAGEIISLFTLAIDRKISLWSLRSLIYAYPTYSLIVKKAGDRFFAMQIASLKGDLKSTLKRNASKIIVGTIWLLALFALYNYQQTYGLSVTELAIKLFNAITSTAWAPLLYILAYTIRPITFFPGTALTILSGVFFGLWGILYTIIGANLSATLAYFVGRFFSQKKHAEQKTLAGWTQPLHQNPFITILTMRLTFFPFDVVNYGAGLLRVAYVPFILATIIGTLLGIATFVTIGASISVEEFIKNGISVNAIDGKFLLVSVIIFILSHLAVKFVKK